MHMVRESMGFLKLWVSSKDGWRRSWEVGHFFLAQHSLNRLETLPETQRKRVLIRKVEGEIIHQKPSLHPLRSTATVKCFFFF